MRTLCLGLCQVKGSVNSDNLNEIEHVTTLTNSLLHLNNNIFFNAKTQS